MAQHIGGKKRLASLIRPDIDEPDTAARWLLNALDDDHKTAFHAHHLMRAARIGREHGCDVLMSYVATSTGYDMPEPAPIKSQRLQMLERQSELAKEQLRLQHELEAINDD